MQRLCNQGYIGQWGNGVVTVAFITGITGQDGSYLSELLLSKGYDVVGFIRPGSNTHRIGGILDRITLVEGSLLDQDGLIRIIKKYKPDEIYNLASPSFAQTSSEHPVSSADVVALGVTRLLESIKSVNSDIRFYQAGSSELFGNTQESPQDERTVFSPTNLYAVSKLYAHWVTSCYRTNDGLFTASGICFVHDSPRRDTRFVIRKITEGAARIKLGLLDGLSLGNLDSRRDWGYAKDYVVAMWLMLQNDVPTDYVIGTGTSYSVRDACDLAFRCVGLDYRDHIYKDTGLYRADDSSLRVSNPKNIYKDLGWKSTTSFEELITLMVLEDLNIARGEYEGA